jgi:sugar lactone lactonase YvrE
MWVDIECGVLHLFDPDTGRESVFAMGTSLGVAVPRASGGFALAVADGFAVVDAADGQLRHVATLNEPGPAVRMNDGRCDSLGRFWAGTIGLRSERGAAALYRLDPDFSVERVLNGVTISNGIDWSTDDQTMFYVDSATQRVDCFDFDVATGSVTNRRTFATIAPEDGEPDGLTVDGDGRVWVAVWGAGEVRCYEPDGREAGRIRLPVSNVTSCAFGGPHLTDLYVTSAESPEPDAGALFRVRTPFRGRPANVFAG